MNHNRLINKADPSKFKPVIKPTHNIVFKWLIDEGYTIGFLALALAIDRSKLNRLFIVTSRIDLHQLTMIILLLKDKKEEIDVINALLLHKTVANEEQKKELKQIHDLIKLPSSKEPIYRADHQPKE